jgi:hypothetical protein
MRHRPRSMASTLFLRCLPFFSTHQASPIGIILYLCGINPFVSKASTFVTTYEESTLGFVLRSCYVMQVYQHYLCLSMLCASTLLILVSMLCHMQIIQFHAFLLFHSIHALYPHTSIINSLYQFNISFIQLLL